MKTSLINRTIWPKLLCLSIIWAASSITAKGQLSYRIKALSLHTIEDLEDYISQGWLTEGGEEAIIEYGPYLSVCGEILNNTDHDIDVDSLSRFVVSYEYKGQTVQVEQTPLNYLDCFSFTGRIAAGTVIENADFGAFLFKDTALDTLNKTKENKGRSSKIRRGKRLARIARKILPTIRVVILDKSKED